MSINVNRFLVADKVSIFPNKLVKYAEINRVMSSNDIERFNNTVIDNANLICSDDGSVYRDVKASSKVKKEIVRKFHNFEISYNARKTLIQKVNWLYQLSKSKSVRSYSGKIINNFKINFITLTLPSKQMHNTQFITNEIFNQFMTEVRQRTGIVNYVWRLEFQSNGNVHYHIVTDIYIDFYFLRKIWNRILDKYGYIERYKEQMNKLTLNDYLNKYWSGNHNEYNVACKRYASGKASNWSNPNSVDVKSCTNDSSIAYYISKYFSKEQKSKCNKNELDNEENSKSLRLWFCSRSLSKLKTIVNYIESMEVDLYAVLKSDNSVKVLYYDYCTVIYFEFKKLAVNLKSLLAKLFREYSYSLGYIPSS